METALFFIVIFLSTRYDPSISPALIFLYALYNYFSGTTQEDKSHP